MVTASNLTPLTERLQWQKLAEHYQTIRDTDLRTLFAADAERGERLVLEAVGIYLDYSKNRLTEEPLAREANVQVAAAVATRPDRFAGIATLPTPDPQAATGEFERAVRQLGFEGAVTNGRTQDRYLDDPRFRAILDAAVSLDIPIYLHPTVPSQRCRMPTIQVLIRM